MFKKYLKVILIVIGIGILGYTGYFIYASLQYAKAIADDSVHAEMLRLSSTLENGDIIFQTSKSNQSKAIQVATGSEYSHMGIIYWEGVNLYVYEAVQPVKLTKLADWINRGEDRKYVVKRLQNSATILTPENLSKMKEIGDKFKDKDYDIYFEWSDDKIYCSELVWKIYKEALNIEIGHLQELKNFNLDDALVKEKMIERYGDNIPMDEIVISPASMFNSDKLETITKN